MTSDRRICAVVSPATVACSGERRAWLRMPRCLVRARQLSDILLLQSAVVFGAAAAGNR